MTRRNSSLGFLGRFGRSEDLRSLDAALRAVDVHPAMVPDAVKLTIVNLMKDQWPHAEPPASAYPPVAQLFGFCIVGPDEFARSNGPDAAGAAERRLDMALDREESFDAQLVLLALHSKLVSPKLVAQYGLSASTDE